MSHSARGAWIETFRIKGGILLDTVALREGCVDRNLHITIIMHSSSRSHSARGAWIETYQQYNLSHLNLVALREGCVDRNRIAA